MSYLKGYFTIDKIFFNVIDVSAHTHCLVNLLKSSLAFFPSHITLVLQEKAHSTSSTVPVNSIFKLILNYFLNHLSQTNSC